MRIRATIDSGRFKTLLTRIRTESDFSQVVLTGINEIQREQRLAAPIRKNRSIPKSIKAGRVVQKRNTWQADSSTDLVQAVVTNVGSGLHGPSRSAYPITQTRRYRSGPNKGQEYEINISHPGVRGTHWWERGTELGGLLAFRSFQNKVERMLREV